MVRLVLGAVALVAAAALVLGACGGDDGTGGDGGGGNGGSAQTSTQEQASEDRGDLRLTLEPPETADDEAAAALVEETETVATIVAALNESINLPADVDIVFASTDEGPYYDPSTRTIVVGYPFVNEVAGTFVAADPDLSEEELAQKTDGVVDFVLVHELGHALVDQLEIPITGREEDAVDNLATVMTVSAIDETGQIALSFAEFFSLLQEDPSQLTEMAFWDEHSLDAQRAFTTICLVYGSDPDAYADLAEYIPEDRAQRCPEEWEAASSGWERLLEPHVKE